jgi:hypothetical protein
MSLRPPVTSCHQNVSTGNDFGKNRCDNVPCQSRETRFSRFIGREFGLVGLQPSSEVRTVALCYNLRLHHYALRERLGHPRDLNATGDAEGRWKLGLPRLAPGRFRRR